MNVDFVRWSFAVDAAGLLVLREGPNNNNNNNCYKSKQNNNKDKTGKGTASHIPLPPKFKGQALIVGEYNIHNVSTVTSTRTDKMNNHIAF